MYIDDKIIIILLVFGIILFLSHIWINYVIKKQKKRLGYEKEKIK